jgi:hypothetical protein
MAYAERADAAATERGIGTILTNVGARLHQAGRINARLAVILGNLRQEPPSAIAAGRPGDAPEPRRPLADMIERIEHAQEETSKLLEEIETLIG